jgi:hypothetical protein
MTASTFLSQTQTILHVTNPPPPLLCVCVDIVSAVCCISIQPVGFPMQDSVLEKYVFLNRFPK